VRLCLEADLDPDQASADQFSSAAKYATIEVNFMVEQRDGPHKP
jgi:hypothetical protein